MTNAKSSKNSPEARKIIDFIIKHYGSTDNTEGKNNLGVLTQSSEMWQASALNIMIQFYLNLHIRAGFLADDIVLDEI